MPLPLLPVFEPAAFVLRSPSELNDEPPMMSTTQTTQTASTPMLELSPTAREPVTPGYFAALLVIAAATIAVGAYAAFGIDAGDRVVRGIAVLVAVAWVTAGVVIARVRREPIAIWCSLVGAVSAAAALCIAK